MARKPKETMTHEAFIHAIRDFVLRRLNDEEREAFAGFKLAYGSGPKGTRGVTFFKRWKCNGHEHSVPFVEISAFGEESRVQLAGTTIHELGHVLAGPGAGHDKTWKAACGRLGLRRIHAAGTDYKMANFDPEVRLFLAQLPDIEDGAPVTSLAGMVGGFGNIKMRACGAGIGTRGGTSRGAGSGSRLKKAWCETCGYTVRVTRAWLDIGPPHCPHHGAMRHECEGGDDA